MAEKQMLPNATTVLVLGICSIVFSCLFVGVVLGIIGLVLATGPRKMFKDNPELYEGNSSLNAGFIMSIIGTALGGIYTVYYIFVGAAAFSFWSHHNSY
jgi:hypothetical protein